MQVISLAVTQYCLDQFILLHRLHVDVQEDLQVIVVNILLQIIFI